MGITIDLRFSLKMTFIFLDLVSLVYEVTNPAGIYYSFIILFKSGFHISVASEATIKTWAFYSFWVSSKVVINHLMASIFLDLVCSVYEVTNSAGIYYRFMIFFKSGYISVPCVGTIATGAYYSFGVSSKSGY